MEIVNVNPKFMKKVFEIFDNYGDGNIAYDTLGYLFSDYFMDNLVALYKGCKIAGVDSSNILSFCAKNID